MTDDRSVTASARQPTDAKGRGRTDETSTDGDTTTGEPRQFRARVPGAVHSNN